MSGAPTSTPSEVGPSNSPAPGPVMYSPSASARSDRRPSTRAGWTSMGVGGGAAEAPPVEGGGGEVEGCGGGRRRAGHGDGVGERLALRRPQRSPHHHGKHHAQE